MRSGPATTETLWERADANRIRAVAVVGVFLTVGSVLFTLYAVPVSFIALIGGAFVLGYAAEDLDILISLLEWIGAHWVEWSVAVLVLTFLLGVANVVYTLLRSGERLAIDLGAVPLPHGEGRKLRSVLEDMKLAAGLPYMPALHVMTTDAVNACAVGLTARTAVVAVSWGFLKDLTIDEQRAVMAGVVSRIALRDTQLSTLVCGLMRVIQSSRGETAGAIEGAAGGLIASAGGRGYRGSRGSDGTGALVGIVILLTLWPLKLAAMAALKVYRSVHLRVAERADTEAMLLLKEPKPMLTALARVIRAPNQIVLAKDAYGLLFFSWPHADDGSDSTPGLDPEEARLQRIWQVLGAEGVVTVRQGEIRWLEPDGQERIPVAVIQDDIGNLLSKTSVGVPILAALPGDAAGSIMSLPPGCMTGQAAFADCRRRIEFDIGDLAPQRVGAVPKALLERVMERASSGELVSVAASA